MEGQAPNCTQRRLRPRTTAGSSGPVCVGDGASGRTASPFRVPHCHSYERAVTKTWSVKERSRTVVENGVSLSTAASRHDFGGMPFTTGRSGGQVRAQTRAWTWKPGTSATARPSHALEVSASRFALTKTEKHQFTQCAPFALFLNPSCRASSCQTVITAFCFKYRKGLRFHSGRVPPLCDHFGVYFCDAGDPSTI